jgi:hypothetical protein
MAEPSYGFDNVSKATMTQNQESDSMKSLAADIWAKGSDMSKSIGSGNGSGNDTVTPNFPKMPGQSGGVPATDVTVGPPEKPIVVDGQPWPTGNHLDSIVKGDEPKGDPRYRGTDTLPTADPRDKVPPDKIPPIDHHGPVPPDKIPSPDHRGPVPPDKIPPIDHQGKVPPDKIPPIDHQGKVPPDKIPPIDHQGKVPPDKIPPIENQGKVPPDKLPSPGSNSKGVTGEFPTGEPHKTVATVGPVEHDPRIKNSGGVTWDGPVPAPPGEMDAPSLKDPRLSDTTLNSPLHCPSLGEGEGGYTGTLNHKSEQDKPLKPGDLTCRVWHKPSPGEGDKPPLVKTQADIDATKTPPGYHYPEVKLPPGTRPDPQDGDDKPPVVKTQADIDAMKTPPGYHFPEVKHPPIHDPLKTSFDTGSKVSESIEEAKVHSPAYNHAYSRGPKDTKGITHDPYVKGLESELVIPPLYR